MSKERMSYINPVMGPFHFLLLLVSLHCYVDLRQEVLTNHVEASTY